MADNFDDYMREHLEDEGARMVAHVVYALHLLFFYTVLLTILGVILNYIKNDDARGSWLESHYRWQLRTFWYGLLWLVVITPLMFIPLINIVAGGLWVVWWLYRNIKGWLRLIERKPMYVNVSPANSQGPSDSER